MDSYLYTEMLRHAMTASHLKPPQIYCGRRRGRSVPAGQVRSADHAGDRHTAIIYTLRLIENSWGRSTQCSLISMSSVFPENGSLSSDTTFMQSAISGRRTASVC